METATIPSCPSIGIFVFFRLQACFFYLLLLKYFHNLVFPVRYEKKRFRKADLLIKYENTENSSRCSEVRYRCMSILRTIRNYYFYCGIEKEEYNAIKKDAYISNFEVWKILHFLMAGVFFLLFVASLHYSVMETNKLFYLIGFLYSVFAIFGFYLLKKE